MNAQEGHGLKRNLNLFTSVSMLTGCIIGASVFIVPGQLASTIGPSVWISYLIGALLISFSCFVYAQVGSVLPVSGANYALCMSAVNGYWGFLYVWAYFISCSFLYPIMAKTSAEYLVVFFPALGTINTIVAIIILIVTGVLNLLGTNISGKIQNALVVILVTVIAVFTLGGVKNANWSNFSPAFPVGVMPVVVGAVSTYYAFAGVNSIIDMSGEIINPGKNISRTVLISLCIVIVLYAGMSVSLVGLIPASELGGSTPSITASELIFSGWFSYFIALAAIAASWTTLNAIMSSMARVAYVLSKSKILPDAISATNKNNVPHIAIMALTIIGVLMTIFSSAIMRYVNISGLYLLAVSLIVAVASLRIKKKLPIQYDKAEFKLKGIWYYVWPTLTIVTSIFFMILAYLDDPIMSTISVLMLPVGLIAYTLRKKRLESNGLNVDELLEKNLIE